jgi:hypothetical protein
MYNNVGYTTVNIPEKDLEFLITITSPGDMLPKGVIMLCKPPHETTTLLPNSEEDTYINEGFVVASIYPCKTKNDLESMLIGYSTLIDMIRKKYRYLPIIAVGSELSSITVRELAHNERDRLSGVIITDHSVTLPSSFNLFLAKIICTFKGKDYRSNFLGKYDLSLYSAASYLKKAKEHNTADSINDFPKHMPTLLVNFKDDVLFDALDDAYVSGIEKAVSNNKNEYMQTVISFANKVVDGVNDAMTSDSFIYKR